LQPLVDIDIQSEISAADEALLKDGSEKGGDKGVKKPSLRTAKPEEGLELGRNDTHAANEATPSIPTQDLPPEPPEDTPTPQKQPGKHAALATPAVRHLVKQHKINIEDIEGTGREGRVTKEDVQKFVVLLKETEQAPAAHSTSPTVSISQIEDQTRQLTPIQFAMFKQMTRSLSIPHFLYTDSVDFTALSALRKKFNANKEKDQRLSPLPFILKAVSLALQQYPLLNAHLDTTTNANKPQMLVKASHNIGIAVDSPAGLLVPVIKNVQSHSIESLAAEISRISKLARDGKLANADLTGATITVTNIGSIGGGAVGPMITSPQVAIVGVGKARAVPAFGENGELVRKEECVFSWSADHRVVDGAMAARAAEAVRGYLEDMESMLVRLR
jgi:2-oxoisovalerate dehydrogenase E2 component (dihydrolipoyl transacylase)